MTLLDHLARRVRGLRENRGWTRGELATRSGLSVRFLARVEGADGNISVLRLEALARALDTTPDRLVRPAAGPRRIVTLVGLRGAGKSAVGPLLAARLGCPFVEMDALITESSGLTLDQLFELHGERYYRRLEHDTVRGILAREDAAVVAAAGGVVNEPRTWKLLRERTTVVWLRASPEDHWARVVAQGDRRPMADHPAAMEELRSILAAREPIYRDAAITVNTSGASPEQIRATIERELVALANE
ncbi:MAG TPA: shikimate kinase [Candidatus Polarisedimenticolaceae bacterium]|nr:shikimate kinase [Candidatus Polarisedimenticolaceae bacterium]